MKRTRDRQPGGSSIQHGEPHHASGMKQIDAPPASISLDSELGRIRTDSHHPLPAVLSGEESDEPSRRTFEPVEDVLHDLQLP